MYTPAHFAVDAATTQRWLSSVRAGNLVTATSQGLLATFLPLVHVPAEDGSPGVLRGHLARPNDQWRLPPVADAMVIVSGVDGYVSPGWYPSKSEHGRVVPTWDYETLHVHGPLVVHDDAEWVEDVVRRLTDREEATRAHPWSVDDAPRRFVDGQLRAIVGVEVVVAKVEAKAKLSQNRPAADVDGVVRGLRECGADALAARVDEAGEGRWT